MKMEFTAGIRKQGKSLIITIPHEISKVLGLKEGDLKTFKIEEEVD